jgi:hypothetical protein
VVRGGVEPPTFRFSGVADCQLNPVEQEYSAVRGRASSALAAEVAVTVAVNEIHGLAAASSAAPLLQLGESGLPELLRLTQHLRGSDLGRDAVKCSEV